jgi:hypothetical protein
LSEKVTTEKQPQAFSPHPDEGVSQSLSRSWVVTRIAFVVDAPIYEVTFKAETILIWE